MYREEKEEEGRKNVVLEEQENWNGEQYRNERREDIERRYVCMMCVCVGRLLVLFGCLFFFSPFCFDSFKELEVGDGEAFLGKLVILGYDCDYCCEYQEERGAMPLGEEG